MLGVFLGVSFKISCKYQPTGLLRISIVHLLAVIPAYTYLQMSNELITLNEERKVKWTSTPNCL